MKYIIEVTTENENAETILETILENAFDCLDSEAGEFEYTIREA